MSDGILVTGATGTTGGLVVQALREVTDRDVRAASRRGPWTFDWDDPATHGPALQGVSAAYLVPPTGALDPAAVMRPFVERSSLKRIVLLSADAVPTGGPGVGQVAAALGGLVPEWAVLRPSWFMQNTVGDHQIARGIRETGRIRTAAGAGRLPFVDAADIAAVAARLLVADEAAQRELVVTGPQSLSYDDVAATISAVSGRSVVHEHVPADVVRDEVYADLGPAYAAVMGDLDEGIAAGRWCAVTEEVAQVTGRPPLSFRAFAEQHAGSWR